MNTSALKNKLREGVNSFDASACPKAGEAKNIAYTVMVLVM